MNSPSLPAMTSKGISIREMTAMAMLGAVIFTFKALMMALPNIHPVAVLMIAGTLCFGKSMFYCAAVYIMLEGLVYGFGLWWISYLYSWPLLILLVLRIKGSGRLFWAIIAGLFGCASADSAPFLISS